MGRGVGVEIGTWPGGGLVSKERDKTGVKGQTEKGASLKEAHTDDTHRDWGGGGGGANRNKKTLAVYRNFSSETIGMAGGHQIQTETH